MIGVGSLHLARPWALLLLAAVPLGLAALRLEGRRAARLRHPRAALLAAAWRSPLSRVAWLPDALLLLALASTALALARPQGRERRAEAAAVEGIDVVIALDLSTSMRAADFEPQDRLHVAKQVLQDFIGRRQSDRIGLVVFAGDAWTQSPLTLDTGILRSLVAQLRFGVIEDGTAIGNAIATAVNRLRESEARSRVVILITDGDNNAGQVSPQEAAEAAKALGIRVFPILVGKGGLVPYPVGVDPSGRTIWERREFPVNPALLRQLAATTGGAYTNATDRESLEHGLQAVLVRMERSPVFEVGGASRSREHFPPLLLAAFWLAAAGIALRAWRFGGFP